MDPNVLIYTCDAPPVDRAEILRYAGVRGDAPEDLRAMLEDCLSEALPCCSYRACYREFPITRRKNLLDLGFAVTDSEHLSRNLADCTSVVLFAATLGIGIDRLISRYGRISPTRSLLLQAIGNERAEALCDALDREIGERMKARGCFTRPRFSPGYGDLPLSLQTDVFSALDCQKRIGLTLNKSLLMSPSKSVTAIIGISPEPKKRPTAW